MEGPLTPIPETTVIRPALLGRFPEVVCAVSTRKGGFSPPPLGMNLSFNVGDEQENVRRNRLAFFGSLQVHLDELAIPGQVHGDHVQDVDGPGIFPETDALITDTPRAFLCVTVADCVPVFLYDAKRRAIAGIHAGWRGTNGRIAAKALALMASAFGTCADDVRAFVGPAASVCCYAVGEDVAKMFAGEFLRRTDSQVFVDLKAANVHQLVRAGVPPGQIEVSPHCTISDPEHFHSYRRDKEQSGRMMGMIGLTG